MTEEQVKAAILYLIKLSRDFSPMAHAYSSTLKWVYDQNAQSAQTQENHVPKAQKAYLPLPNTRSWVYLSRQVDGVEQAIAQSHETGMPRAIPVAQVRNFDPRSGGGGSEGENGEQVALTYGQLAAWGEPDPRQMQYSLKFGGLNLVEAKALECQKREMPPAPSCPPVTEHWCLVACIAEASRHQEWAVMAYMANEIVIGREVGWSALVKSKSWPPMATDANSTMANLKGSTGAGANPGFLESWGRLLGIWMEYRSIDDPKGAVDQAFTDYLGALQVETQEGEEVTRNIRGLETWKLKALVS